LISIWALFAPSDLKAVYICGSDGNQRAVLWDVDRSGTKRATVMLSDNFPCTPYCITASDNFIYTAGLDFSSGSKVLTLWVTNRATHATVSYTLDSSLDNPKVTSLLLYQGKLYLTLDELSSQVPYLYTISYLGTVLNKTRLASKGSTQGISSSKDSIYVIGYESSTRKTLLWITDRQGGNLQAINAKNQGSAGIGVFNGIVYIVNSTASHEPVLMRYDLNGNFLDQTIFGMFDLSSEYIHSLNASQGGLYISTNYGKIWTTPISSNNTTPYSILTSQLTDLQPLTGGLGAFQSHLYALQDKTANLWITSQSLPFSYTNTSLDFSGIAYGLWPSDELNTLRSPQRSGQLFPQAKGMLR
jgi:hypothetical protein